MSESSGALVGLLSTVITGLIAAVAWLYRENRKDKSAEIDALRRERDEWKALALEGLQRAERGVLTAEAAVMVARGEKEGAR